MAMIISALRMVKKKEGESSFVIVLKTVAPGFTDKSCRAKLSRFFSAPYRNTFNQLKPLNHQPYRIENPTQVSFSKEVQDRLNAGREIFLRWIVACDPSRQIKVMTTLKSQKEQSRCDLTVSVFFFFILIMFLLTVIFCQVLSPLMEKCNVALDSSLIQHPFFSPVKANRYFLCIL